MKFQNSYSTQLVSNNFFLKIRTFVFITAVESSSSALSNSRAATLRYLQALLVTSPLIAVPGVLVA